jgi:hypothetical protein
MTRFSLLPIGKRRSGCKLTRLLGMVQQSVALFTWLKIIPTLDAQHGNTGRQKRLGEHEKG